LARILAVDDNEDNIFLLRMILENHDHEILTAYNGKDALDIAKNTAIDLVLLDVMMPGMNGMEVAAHLKKMESTRHVPIILLTAKKKDVEDVVEALASGADEYITKPFYETELVARVTSMLRMKSLFDQISQANKMMAENLQMAQAVQVSMLPTRHPNSDRIKFHTYYEAAASIGGDYYDIIDYGAGKIGILLADVSGHGASAALIVSMIKTFVISQVETEITPVHFAQSLNKKIIKMIPEERYLTMFFGVADLNTNILTYVRAGHPYPLLLRNGDKSTVKLDVSGDIIGLVEDIDVERGEVEFKPGDKLLVYSDGLFEVWDKDGNMYGMENLLRDLKSHSDESGADIVNNLVLTTKTFNAKDSLDDDVAVVLAEFL